MKRTTAAVCGLSRILFAAGTFYWFFYFLVRITEPGDLALPAVLPIVVLAVSYIAGVLASRRGINLLIYIGIQILICAAGITAMQFLMKTGPEAVNLRLTSSIAMAVAAAVCAKAAASEIKAEEIAHRFDVGLILCAVLILADHYLKGAFAETALIVMGAAMLLLLLSLTMISTERTAATGSRAGKVLPAVLIAVIALISAVCAFIGRGAAGSAAGAVLSVLRGIWSGISFCASFLWSKWVAFCSWLATLFEPGESIPINITPAEDQPDIPDVTEPSQTSVIILYVLTALLVLAVITAFIYAIRRTKLKRVKIGTLNNRQAVRQGSLADGIGEAISAFRKKLAYRIDCMRFRNTPAGLLAWCERHVPRSARKLPAETGSQFLLRLSEGQAGEGGEALRALSELLEKAFYSPKTVTADQRLCSAVRKCRF